MKVFILTHRLGGVAVFWLIPGGSVGLISAAAVCPLVIHATEMEGGGESMVTSHLLQGDLFQVVWRSWRNTREVAARILGEPTVPGKIPGGVMVLKKYQGGSGSSPGRANCSREDSRWCSPTSNTRKGSSNPGGELVFHGIDPSGVASRLLLFIEGHLFVYSRGCLITSARLWNSRLNRRPCPPK